MLPFLLQWMVGTTEGISPPGYCSLVRWRCRGGTFGSQPSFKSLWGNIQRLWHWYLISDAILSSQKIPLTSISISTKGRNCAPDLCGAVLMNVCEMKGHEAQHLIGFQPQQAMLRWACKLHSPFCCTSGKQTWIKRHNIYELKNK